MPCRRAVALLCGALLAGCAGTTSGLYSGTVKVTSGSCRGGPATLQVRTSEAVFAGDDSILILTGKVAPDGQVVATHADAGVAGKPYVLKLQGRLDAGGFAGHLVGPDCRAVVALNRAG